MPRFARLFLSRLASLLALVFAILPQMLAGQENACSQHIFHAHTRAGTYVYIEDKVLGQETRGRMELHRQGQTLWSAAAWTGCSNGISICELWMNYTDGSGVEDGFSVPVSFGHVTATDGETICICAFSQLGESLAYLYRKHEGTTLTFEQGRPDAPVLRMNDYLDAVPSIFQGCGCDDLSG